MQPHIIKDLGSLLMLNNHLSMFYFKATSSMITTLPNVDTSFVTITFIQLHISHDYFCFAHLNLIFFCFYASADVYLIFLYANSFHSISYNFNKNIDSYFDPLIFHLIFSSIFKVYYFKISNLTLWWISWSTSMLVFFLNRPIFFYIWAKHYTADK